MKISERREVIFASILVAFIIFLSFYFDGRIVSLISSIRNDIVTDFFMGITFVSSILVVFVFLTILFIKENKRKWILPLWVTLFLSAVVSFLLKVLVQRQRPYQLGIVSIIDGLQKSAHVVWDFSFPSFQAVLVFSAVPFLAKEFPKFKYVWWIFACLVALSRVYFGLHFLSDVLTGAVIGYLIGWVVIKRGER